VYTALQQYGVYMAADCRDTGFRKFRKPSKWKSEIKHPGVLQQVESVFNQKTTLNTVNFTGGN
jgi:hypothetical protein